MDICVGFICIIIGLTGLIVAGSMAWNLWYDWKFDKKLKEGKWGRK